MTTSAFPRPQAVGPGTPIRFAVGSTAGPRSQTWTAVAGAGAGELFLSASGASGPEGAGDPRGPGGPGTPADPGGRSEPARAGAAIIRLVRYRRGWKLEYTAEGARLIPSVRRRGISRWSAPRDSADGWGRAVSIVVPTTSLATEGWTEPVRHDTAFWPAAPAGSVTQFDLMLGLPGHWRLPGEFAGEVGRIALPGVGAAWVVMHYPTLSSDGIEHLARRHSALLDDAGGRTWAVDVARADGSIVLFDFTSDERWSTTAYTPG